MATPCGRPLRPGARLTKVRDLPSGPGLLLPASCSPEKHVRIAIEQTVATELCHQRSACDLSELDDASSWAAWATRRRSPPASPALGGTSVGRELRVDRWAAEYRVVKRFENRP